MPLKVVRPKSNEAGAPSPLEMVVEEGGTKENAGGLDGASRRTEGAELEVAWAGAAGVLACIALCGGTNAKEEPADLTGVEASTGVVKLKP